MTDTPSGTVVFLSGDLMFASRVRGAAENAGLSFYLGGNLPEDDDKTIRYVILDLSTRSSLTESIAQQCAQRCPDATLLAYGPHVQVGKLTVAKESGIPVVMTRGQFDSRLSTMFVT
tara:strand:+ start:146775 stop:147125 length:351 start_codon:yes stop_codon:yes gene_type:complete